MLLLLLGAVTISESVGQCRSLALHLGACWTQIGFLAPQPISCKWKWHGNCLWYFCFPYYIERQNMRKRKVIAAALDHLSPPTTDSMHTYYGLQWTVSHTGASCEVKSSPTLCHSSINEMTSKQSGSFFPRLHSKRVMWCAESEI